MYTVINKCRICGGKDLENVMSLGEQFLTGVFPRDRVEKVTKGPVDLVRCSSSSGCGLVQLKQSYDLGEMYGDNYGYRSGLNPSMVSHLKAKVSKILSLGILKEHDLVIDIGSNDATSLRAYPQDKYDLVGIDPTGQKFESYYPSSIKLIPDFFSAQKVSDIFKDKKAKVITSFSMFYDLEDPVAFAKEIALTLDSEGIWIFEQSYLPAMLKTNSFDTICHEHLEFYALKQILWIAREAGLKVLDVDFNEVNGGSFSITATKNDASYEPNYEHLEKILQEEGCLGLGSELAFNEFKYRVKKNGDELKAFLLSCKTQGKVVHGLGASTKGNVLLQYLGIDESLVAKIGEVNTEKFGSFTPGTLIPLCPESEVLAENPDFLLVLPWHFRRFFESLQSLKGRTLIFPLPEFQIVKL
jgi:NDP-4-keto-2,6-dideoxyhexose 3-C-methyltransferase